MKGAYHGTRDRVLPTAYLSSDKGVTQMCCRVAHGKGLCYRQDGHPCLGSAQAIVDEVKLVLSGKGEKKTVHGDCRVAGWAHRFDLKRAGHTSRATEYRVDKYDRIVHG